MGYIGKSISERGLDVNVNIKMYKKWKIKMYILSVNLPLNSTQKVVSYL